MKHSMSTRLMSLLLTIALLLSCCPFALAAEADEASEPEVIVEQTEAPTEAETSGDEELPPEVTSAEEEPGEAEETEATGETEAIGETEATGETEALEAVELLETPETLEAEHGVLPFGLKGLPEGYVLSEDALAIKQDLVDHDVCAVTEGLTPGVDYVEGEVIVTAESQEQAELYAAAFNAELKSYSYGVAVLGLTDITVPQAVAASADKSLPLPAVSPNHIIRLNPVETDSSDYLKAQASANSAPTLQDWDSWVNSTMKNPDPFLENPAASNYQYMHDSVDSYAAWGVTTGSEDVKVAVLDTGVKSDHTDLKGKVTNFTINSSYGSNDDDGHGTHVAGIIAATMDNGAYGAGIAPNVKILNIKVLGPKGGSSSDIIRGINLAVSKNASVINMSLGGYFYNPNEAAAVKNAVDAGCCVVVAMGNDGSNTMCYPAGYPGVIAVGAADRSNNRAFFSNYGSWLDVSAPGYDIISTSKTGGYEYMSGTSQATPVVSGVVALYKSIHPFAKPAEIEARLKKTATKAGSNLGAGIVNAAKMLSDKPELPDFFIADKSYINYYEDTMEYRGKPVPCESYLEFYCNQYSNPFIVYTLDGSTPAVKNGEVVKGSVYAGERIDLSVYAGKTVTVKAIQVNGLGMASKVLSKKVTVLKTTTNLSVTVNGPSKVIAGKSVQLTAVVNPANKASQAVTWKITSRSDNMAAAKIDSKGNLTVPKLAAGQTGSVTVQAASKTDPSKTGTLTVTVEVMTPVASMVMSQTKATVFAGNTVQLSCAASDAQKNSLNPEVSWVSSNPKVATVSSTGLVTAVAKGSATITCKALDGSGKSAKCTVTVTKKVESITIIGQEDVYCGSSVTYKAEVLPADASNKAVEWYLEDAPDGVSINQKGVLTVSNSADGYKSFYVCARAKDGSGAQYKMLARTIPAPVKSHHVSMWVYPSENPVEETYSSKGSLSSLTMYTVDVPHRTGDESTVLLEAAGFDAGETECVCTDVSWSTSNAAIASIEVTKNGDCRVIAHKAGTVKITATALDGSKKKATVTVKVLVPASSIAISAKNARMNYSNPFLAVGKSATNKAVFADTYGKPSNQKVTWSYSVEAGGSNVTSYVQGQKWISVSGGKLSVSSKMGSYVANKKLVYVTVTATATDGTGVSGSITYVLVKPATKMVTITKTISTSPYMETAGFFACDQWFPYNNPGNCDFIATSSNPEVASVEFTGDTNYSYKGMPVYGVKINTCKKTGTAKITIKTVDGSNKSCSFTVKVK